MILTWPPQLLQISTSMLNTRFRRCAQVVAARRSARVVSSRAPAVLALLPLATSRWHEVFYIEGKVVRLSRGPLSGVRDSWMIDGQVFYNLCR